MRNRTDSRIQARILSILLLVLVKPSHVIETEVAVIKMILGFSPHHWYSKLQLQLTVGPTAETFHTSFAHHMWGPRLVLITKFHIKVYFVRPLDKVCNISLLLAIIYSPQM